MLPSASFLQFFIKVDLQAVMKAGRCPVEAPLHTSTFETSVHRLTVYG